MECKHEIAQMMLSDLHSVIKFEFHISAIKSLLIWIDYELGKIWHKHVQK